MFRQFALGVIGLCCFFLLQGCVVASSRADGVLVVRSVTGTWQGQMSGSFYWGGPFAEDVLVVLVEVAGGGITGSMQIYHFRPDSDEEGYDILSIMGTRDDQEIRLTVSLPFPGFRGCYLIGTLNTANSVLSGTLDCPLADSIGSWEWNRVR